MKRKRNAFTEETYGQSQHEVTVGHTRRIEVAHETRLSLHSLVSPCNFLPSTLTISCKEARPTIFLSMIATSFPCLSLQWMSGFLIGVLPRSPHSSARAHMLVHEVCPDLVHKTGRSSSRILCFHSRAHRALWWFML